MGVLAALGTASDSCCAQIDLLQHDISQLQQPSRALWADVVIMNPPFGTRRKGADLEFLRAAFQVGSVALDPACCAAAALHSTCACNTQPRVTSVHTVQFYALFIFVHSWWCSTSGGQLLQVWSKVMLEALAKEAHCHELSQLSSQTACLQTHVLQ